MVGNPDMPEAFMWWMVTVMLVMLPILAGYHWIEANERSILAHLNFKFCQAS